MKKIFLPLLLCLSACTPYEYAARETAADAFEITIKAAGENEIDSLKDYLVARGDELCGHRIFRLRGLREDTHFNPPAQEINGEIECMGVEPS